MQNYSLKFKVLKSFKTPTLNEKEIIEVITKTYSSRKSSDPPGDFRYPKTGEINSRTLPLYQTRTIAFGEKITEPAPVTTLG